MNCKRTLFAATVYPGLTPSPSYEKLPLPVLILLLFLPLLLVIDQPPLQHSDRHLFEQLLLDQHTRKSALRPADAELLALTENPHAARHTELDADEAAYRAPEPTAPPSSRGHRQYVPIEKKHHKKREHSS